MVQMTENTGENKAPQERKLYPEPSLAPWYYSLSDLLAKDILKDILSI